MTLAAVALGTAAACERTAPPAGGTGTTARCSPADRDGAPQPAAERAPLLSEAALAWIAQPPRRTNNPASERQIDPAGVAHEPGSLPPTYAGPAAFDPVGDWQIARGLDSASLHIRPGADGRLDVLFRTSGCVDDWTLRRTATFDRGVLTLDRPVDEYFPACYERLFALRWHGVEYLVSEACEGVVDALARSDPESTYLTELDWYGFERLSRERVEEIEQSVSTRQEAQAGEPGG